MMCSEGATFDEVLRKALISSPFVENGNFDPFSGNTSENENNVVRLFLYEAWARALQARGQDSSASSPTATITDDWFEKIWKVHNEAGRHYHTSVHLQEMISYFDLYRSHSSQFPEQKESLTGLDEKIILLSIFFHDAVYDAKSNTNEEDSANLFEEFYLESGISDEPIRSKVVEYILATKKHDIFYDGTRHDASSGKYPLQLFLDLDMLVLGKSSGAYMKYASMIREEYIHVPEDLYCSARAKILQAFVTKPSVLYGVPVMRHAFEDNARKNLQEEIKLLQEGTIPSSK